MTVLVGWDAMPRTTQYEIQYREVGTTAWSASLFSPTNSVMVDLEEGKSYQFRVRSICGSEISDWSYLGVPVYSNDGSCTIPSGMTVEQLPGTYDFRISWNNNSNAQGWNFRYRRQGDLTWTIIAVTSPTITLSSLVIGATYEYQVQTICVGGTVSDWSNTGTFQVRSSTATQSCPITYEEEFSGTLIGRKDSSNVVTIGGDIQYIDSTLPEAGDFAIVGYLGLCCAPIEDIVVPMSGPAFSGELTISASGQMTLYVDSYTGTPAISFTLSGLTYQGFEGECPESGGGGSNEITGTITVNCSDAGCTQQGQTSIHITFPSATPAPITLLMGVIEQLSTGQRYRGSDIFSPPAGATPQSPTADAHAPYLLNIPAGVTSFTSSGNIVQQGFSDSVHAWTCHSCLRPVTDLYVKVSSPATYVANFSITNANITLHNV